MRRGEKVSAATMNRYVDALNAVIARQRTPVADFSRGVGTTAEKLPWDFRVSGDKIGRIERLDEVELAPVFGYNNTTEEFASPRIFPDPIFGSDYEEQWGVSGGYVSLFFSLGALFELIKEIHLTYDGLAKSGEQPSAEVYAESYGALDVPLAYKNGATIAGIAFTSFDPEDPLLISTDRLNEIYGGATGTRRAVVLGHAYWDAATKKYIYNKYTSSPIFLPVWY